MLKNIYIVFLFVIILVTCIGCGDSSSDGREFTKHPGYEYMPNMYRSPSYETYSENPLFNNNSTARQPVKGTIARGFMPFEYNNSLEDYLRAGNNLTNPLEKNSDNLLEGEALYGMFCAHCHGKNGDGGQADGTIVEYFTNAPSFIDSVAPRIRSDKPMIELEPGHIYHTIFYDMKVWVLMHL